MSKTYRIEELITIVDERNSDNKDLPLLGINLSKSFFPSVANVIGTDLSRYKVIRKGRFACNMMHVGRDMKVPVALYLEEKEAIISPAYPMFTVSDENIIVPEYLMLFFKNSEFDREAGFYASAGIRGGFDWEDFCNITLPVPPIEEQRRIVSEYQTVERRIKNNEAMIKKLEETAQAIYHHTFVEGIDENNLPEGWKKGCIGDLGDVIGGATPSTEIARYWVDEGISWLSPADMPRNVMYINKTVKHITEEAYNSASTKILPVGTVLFSSRAPIGLTAITDIELCTNQGYKSVVPSVEVSSLFVYYLLLKERTVIANQQEGSTFAEISGKELAAYEIIIPSISSIREFTYKVEPIAKLRKNFERETSHLRTLLSLLTSKLA